MTRDVSVAGLICALLFLCITFGSARAFASEQVFSKVRDSVVVLKVLNARGEKIRSGSAYGRLNRRDDVGEDSAGMVVDGGHGCTVKPARMRHPG